MENMMKRVWVGLAWACGVLLTGAVAYNLTLAQPTIGVGKVKAYCYYICDDATCSEDECLMFDDSTNTWCTDPACDCDGDCTGHSSITDTGPSPDCSGTTTYQDGEGNCDDLSAAYQALDASLTTIAGLTETRGDIMLVDATPEWTALPIGAANSVLFSDGTDAAWDATPAIDCTDCTNAGGSPGGADTNVQYQDGAGDFGGEAAFTYDDSTDVMVLSGSANPTLDLPSGGIEAEYIGVQEPINTSYSLYVDGPVFFKDYMSIGAGPSSSFNIYNYQSHTQGGGKTVQYNYGSLGGSTAGANITGFKMLGISTNSNGNHTVNGGEFLATHAGDSRTLTTGSYIGGNFSVTSGSGADNNTYGSSYVFRAGEFSAQILGDNNTMASPMELVMLEPRVDNYNNAVTDIYSIRMLPPFGGVPMVGGVATVTNWYGLFVEAHNVEQSNVERNPDITNSYGIYIDDQTYAQNNTVADSIYVAAQDGTNKGATVGNVRFAGNGFDEGHIQIEDGHIWWDDGTDTLRVSKDADGSAPTADTDGLPIPLAHAGISAVGNSTATSIASDGVAVQVTIFDTNSTAFIDVPDHTNDHITITETGTYMIISSATVNSGAGSAFKFEMTVQKNNGASEVGACHVDRNLAAGGGVAGAVSMSCLAVLTAADTLEVWVENETNTTDITVEDITLSIVRIK